MCGICGQVVSGDGRADGALVSAMTATLRHRGPDDEGVAVIGPAALGATRLAIIDVAGGHQPIANDDGTVWAVQNGEIYNYAALRAELAAAGHRFTSHSDTEVLVHLYEAVGLAFVERLRGMFALAIWDAPRRRLVLARDRLGIKPLYHTWPGTGDRGDSLVGRGPFLFASEIKALLAAGLPRALDPVALHDYLTFDYVPGPRAMFAGVRKLPAGHMLVRSGDGPAEIMRYWDFPPQPDPADPLLDATSAELKAGLSARLEDAVRSCLVSDVPVGAFLSGGLDSSVIVALMARLAGDRVRTFSVGFRERSYNELPYARTVATHFATEHTELVVEPRIESIVHRLVDAFDEPFADSSAVGTWVVSEAAAGQTKVVLSGDGGDEVFGGYVIYHADRLAGLYRRLPAWLGGRLVPALVDRLPASHEKMSLDLKLRRFVAHARSDPAAAHMGWRAIFTDEMKARLYDARFDAAAGDSFAAARAAYAAYPGADTLNRFLVLDARTSLVDDMLTKVDRTSMAHGLEVRVPLLDHPLVEWMTRVPSRHKVRRLSLKHLFREVARDLLPRAIVDRPKAGFHVPVPLWLNGELAGLVTHQLGPATVARQGVFDASYVQGLVDEHRSGHRDHSRNLWGLLMFGLWFERHIERR